MVDYPHQEVHMRFRSGSVFEFISRQNFRCGEIQYVSSRGNVTYCRLPQNLYMKTLRGVICPSHISIDPLIITGTTNN